MGVSGEIGSWADLAINRSSMVISMRVAISSSVAYDPFLAKAAWLFSLSEMVSQR